jgi:DHA1 family bicyclomycin/chloramphenicol resistance-like MFS transporter
MPQAEQMAIPGAALKSPSRATLLLLGALTAFGPMSLDLYLPAFEQIADEFDVQLAGVGLTFSVSLLGLGIGQLFYGPLSDRYGRKTPLIVGLIIFISASIACAFAINLESLIAFRFLQALGGSAGIVIARTMVRDTCSGKELARVLSLVAVVLGLAPILAPSIGAGILRFGSWRFMFIGLALFGLICLIGVLKIKETLPPSRRVEHTVHGALRNYLVVVRQKGFIAPATISALNSMGLFAYISSSPRIYLGEYDLTSQQFGWAFGLGALAFTIGAQVNARLLSRCSTLSLTRTYLVVQIVAVVGGLVVVVAQAPVIFLVVALAAYQSCSGGIMGNALSEALRNFLVLAGTAVALVGVMQLGSSAMLSAALTVIPLPPALLLMIVLAAGTIISLAITQWGTHLRPNATERAESAHW